MSRVFQFVLATACTGYLATAVWSQTGQGGGGAGASGQAGSASGGAAAGSNAASSNAAGNNAAGAAAQNQPNSNASRQQQAGRANGNFGGIAQRPFFADPGARQQLNLNDNQYQGLNQAYQQAWNRYSEGMNRLDRNLNEQQRQQELQRLQSEFDRNFNRTLDTTFTDPTFRQRYNQLNWQYQGLEAFNDPSVRQQLNLTSQQQRQLRQLQADWRRRMQRGGRTGDNNRAGMTAAELQQMRQQYQTQLNSLLTPQQQQIWNGMVGQPYQYPADFLYPGVQNPRGVVPYSADRRAGSPGSGIGTQNNPTPSPADQDTQNQTDSDRSIR